MYIGGLAKSATDAQIKEFCEAAGEVFNLRCTKDPGIPGKNRGYAGFVCYSLELYIGIFSLPSECLQ